MRLRSFLMVCLAGLAILATAGPSSFAENDTGLVRDPTLQRGRGFGFPFFRQYEPPRPVVRQRVAPVQQPRRAASTVVVRDDPVIPKVDVSSWVAVMGDSLGELLAGGLDESFADRPDVAILRKARADSGLVRADFHDWPRAVAELLAGPEKISVGVMLLGVNDRQPIREGEVTHEPLSERWIELYRGRIDAIADAFARKRVPLIWVGAPPTQNPRLSADLVLLNDLFRQRVERAGGSYVDLWNGFVDAENRYAAVGPDYTGQPTRLRLGDGVHFTRAGARKAAFFVDGVVRRLIERGPTESIIALPVSPDTGAPINPELQPGGIERLIDRMVAGLPALDLPVLPVKPLAGPILPLTGAAFISGATLLRGPQEVRLAGEVMRELDRVFVEGVAPEPKPGRADDHRWPK